MTAPTVANPFVEFLDRYEHDPVLFVREVLDADPDENQTAILRDMARGDPPQVAIRSGHRVGKTWTMAWLICWHACTRFPQKTICTSSTDKQLKEGLAAETKAWFKKLPPRLLESFEIKVESIELVGAPEESFVSFRTAKAENSEAFGGIHSANVLLICDEASGIPEPIFEALGGSMASPNARWVLTGNPLRSSGTFFKVFRRPEIGAFWKTYHISCIGHPRVPQRWIDAERVRYGGEDDNRFRVRVLGEFPKADDDTIIPFELAEMALDRDVMPNPGAPIIWGLDCGRGGDASALAKRQGNVLLDKVQLRGGRDLMELAGWVKSQYDASIPEQNRPSEINIDSIGMGAGVYDRLRELKLPVRSINTAEEASAKEQYHKLRTELWFTGFEWLNRKDCNLHGDVELVDELIAQKVKFHSNGKQYALSKDEMKSLGVRSPNRADAFLLTLASDNITLAHGGGRRSWSDPVKRNVRGIV